MLKNVCCLLIPLLCLFFSTQASAFNHEINGGNLYVFLEHPLVLLVVGFLLTGIIGQCLIGHIQRKNWEYQFKIERLSHQIKEARTTHEYISLLLDKRIYRSRKLYYSFNDRDIHKINDKCDNRFKEFNDILYKWNDSLNSNIAKVDIYFGQQNKKKFQDRLCKDLIWIGTLLRRYYFNMDNKPSLANINKAINITNERIYQMNKKMLLEIRKLEDKLRVNKN